MSNVVRAKLFTVRIFTWKRDEDIYTMSGGWGSYRIEKFNPNFHEGDWKWRLHICFDEYYDESWHDFDALFKAKRFAWEDWKKRILPALRKWRWK